MDKSVHKLHGDMDIAKKAKLPNPFTGRWRIISMSAWDQEFIDEEEEGYFEFDDKDNGKFHFGYVHGQMGCCLAHGKLAERREIVQRTSHLKKRLSTQEAIVISLLEDARYLRRYLMRRNILAYKAPPNNEGYDLICIHPDPRHQLMEKEVSQVRIQVKSRYATDCDRGFPVKEASLDAFDFLVVVQKRSLRIVQ
jgi:hypothetical protein